MVSPNCGRCDEPPLCAGYFSVEGYSGDDHPHTLMAPCYDSATHAWYVLLDSVETTVDFCVDCDPKPDSTVCEADVASMTAEQAEAHLENFPNLTENPPRAYEYRDRRTTNYCDDCTVRHEESHMNRDWIELSLQPEIDEFHGFLLNYPIVVNCSVSSSTDCDTALTPSRETALHNEWDDHVYAAYLAWGANISEELAEAAEVECYRDIITALQEKASSQ